MFSLSVLKQGCLKRADPVVTVVYQYSCLCTSLRCYLCKTPHLKIMAPKCIALIMCGSHRLVAKDSGLLGCDPLVLGEWFLMFGRNNVSISLTLRSLMLYIYGAPILDVSRSHTMTQHSR